MNTNAVEVGEHGLVVNGEVLCSRDDLLEYTAHWGLWMCGPTVRVVVTDNVTNLEQISAELAKCWPGANITVMTQITNYRPSWWQ